MIVVNARFLTQPITGVQRFAIEICKILNNMNLNIQFVSPKNIIHKELANELNVKTDLPLSSLKGHLWEQISLPLYLRQINANYLLINLANTGPITIKNQIYGLMDVGFKINPSWYSAKFSFFYNTFVPILLKRCKHVITISNTSKEGIIKNYSISSEKISVIYTGYNLPTLRKNTNFSKEEENYILSVSSFDPRKNLNTLIEAFSELNINGLKLILVGKFSKNFKAFDFLKNENVKLLSNVNDEELVELYHNAKLFVYPSHYEGFGLPILEAMHFNLKICASNIDCFKELFADKIHYFDQNSPKDMARVMDNVLKSKNDNIDYQEVIHKYTWENSANLLKNIIFKVLKY